MGTQTGLAPLAMGPDPAILYAASVGIGIAFAYFGLGIYDALLSVVGAVLGGSAGAALGWLYLPEVFGLASPGPWVRLVLALAVALVGIKLGAALLIVFNRLAVMVMGFLAGGLAAFVMLIGENLQRLPEYVESLAALPSSEVLSAAMLQRPIAVVVVAGVVGAVLAWRFFSVVVAFATSVFGAFLVGLVVPVWLQGGGVVEPLAVLSAVAVPNAWFYGVLATGLLFQLGAFHFELHESVSTESEFPDGEEIWEQ